MAKTSIAVYLGEEYFVAVELKQHNTGGELLRYAVYSPPESGCSEGWLKGIWKKEFFSHTKVIALLPQDLVKYKTLTLPALSDEQLQAAVRLEMESSEPGACYRIINIQQTEQHILVKLALINEIELGSYLSQFQNAGLTVEWSGLNFHGLQNYLSFNFDFFEGAGADIYLSVNNTCSEIVALTDTELIFRRALPMGKNYLKENPSKHLPEFAEEARLTLTSYQVATNFQLPERIWLFGEARLEMEWSRQLTGILGIPLVIPDQTRLSGVITGNHTPILAPLIGLALDETWLFRKDWRFKTREQLQQERKRRKMMTAIKAALAGALLVCGLILGIQARVIRDQKDSIWLAEQREKATRLRDVEIDANQKAGQLKNLEKWLNRRGLELEFLRVLEANLPERTQITDLIIEDGVVKSLSGSTVSVSILLERLRQTPELSALKLKGTITTDKSGMELFQLEGTFLPGEKKP
ncbi:MAG: hypothetical protein GX075_05885 [Firmicutes bacterium]|nr:hypothetical protein [Bacillota bacterium]